MATITPENRASPEAAARREASHNAMRRRTLQHMRAGSTDLDKGPMHLDPSIYTDPGYAEREKQALFHDLPVVACLSRDLPEAGSKLTFDVLGPAVLLVRGKDRTVKAFLNMCVHRAARLVSADPGGACDTRKRITCPFHGWTFDLDGKLIGMPGKEGFEGMPRENLNLIEIPCAEKYGLVFVRLNANGDPIDVDAHLGTFAEEIAHLELEKADPVSSSVIEAEANWKYALDTYGESYHFAILHPNTIGKLAPSNIMVYENYGLHARLAFPREEFMPYQDLPENDWPQTHYGGLYMLFPNVVINVNSIIGVGQFYGISRVFPGDHVAHSRTLMTTYQPAHGGADVDRAKWEEMHRFIDHVVTSEDYSVSATGQRNLQYAPASFRPVLGANEIALQHWHRNAQSIMRGTN